MLEATALEVWARLLTSNRSIWCESKRGRLEGAQEDSLSTIDGPQCIEKVHLLSTECCSNCLSYSVLSDSLRPRGLEPTRLLCPWDSSGKNAGAGCHFLLQGILPTQGWNPHLLHWQVDSFTAEPGTPTPPILHQPPCPLGYCPQTSTLCCKQNRYRRKDLQKLGPVQKVFVFC